MSGITPKQCHSKLIPLIIVFTFLWSTKCCLGQDVNTNKYDLSQEHSILRQGNKQKEREKNIASSNVITSEILPLQMVAPNEPGFDLTEQEIAKLKLWPSGIIPYLIDDYSFDKTMSTRLQHILSSVNSVTGLRFTELSQPPESADERWVLFLNRRGVLTCNDYNTKMFTNKGVQKVVVGYDCIRAGGGSIAPIVLALVGVPPQHNAPDRDTYITVKTDNIIPEQRRNFEKVQNNEWLFHDMKYDFLSAGHYDFYKYTVNGSATIVPKFEVKAPVGEDDGFSYNDIWKMKMLYNYITSKPANMETASCSKLFKVKDKKKFNDVKILKGKTKVPRKKPLKYQNNDDNNNNQTKMMKKLAQNGAKRGPTGGAWEHSDYDTA